ncbi:hypothetical protein [Sandaracinus amylolyticus]|uniref:Uncharacterized protein n=1 Tax=Sandaracinus amylolyticus TaxID=927083 RepID=A0A0F6YKV6_9BACT|nr:hypothetical protein [Sandaracinus amylolyticus]AKF08826.1 hypothetical protein DB32_005975 [Sandaracinus amylolyticus]
MVLLTIVIAILLLVCLAFVLAARRRRPPEPVDARREAPPEIVAPPEVVEPAPEPDAVWLAALEMARTAHLVAQHLGFEAIPDRDEPSVRRLRIALRNELERRAAERLASTSDLACVRRIEITPDARHAVALVDTAAPPPA